jgi:hypothetical protein
MVERFTFTVWGVQMRCHVLNDGQRVIDAEDAQKFFTMLEEGAPIANDAELQAFTDWLAGKAR